MKKYLNNSLFLPIILFLLLYIWHPFFLGIYSDDWGLLLSFFVDKPGDMTPFSFDRLYYFFLQFTNRPVTGFLYYLISSICSYNIFLIHLVILFLVLLSILSLNLFLKEFFKFIEFEYSEKYTTLTLIFWISSPWILGVTVWLSSSLTLVSMIFFHLSTYFLLKSWRNGKKTYILAILFYLLSCFTYESFYFHFLIIIAFGFILRKQKQLSLKALIVPTIYYTVVVLTAIIWNRYSLTVFEKSVHKGANSYLFQTFLANIVSLPYTLIASIVELSFILVPAFLIILYFFIKAILLGKQKDSIEFKKILLYVTFIIFGIILGLFIYSGAGYTVWGIGSRSRTLLVPSFYFSLLFSFFIYYINKYLLNKRKLLDYLIIITIVSLSIINIIRGTEWHEAWVEQKEIISKVPVEALSRYDSTTTVIFDGPYKKNWISVIDANWAIDFQFKYGHLFNKSNSEFKPLTNVNFEVGRGMVHPVLNKPYSIYWDGSKIITGYDFDTVFLRKLKEKYYNKIDTIPAKNLIVWHYDSNLLEYFEPPVKITLEPFYNYDYWITWIWTYIFKKE